MVAGGVDGKRFRSWAFGLITRDEFDSNEDVASVFDRYGKNTDNSGRRRQYEIENESQL